MNEVSVVIITRNRQSDLLHCLGSLVTQTVKPDELIIVDNGSTDETRNVVKSFEKNVDFPLRLYKETKRGYPFARNKGLKMAQYPWIAFIDDDCVADSDWYKDIKKNLEKHRGVVAVVGNNRPFFSQDMISLVKYFINSYWIQQAVSLKNRIQDFEILDTKNIVYNNDFLRKNKIRFDSSKVDWGGGVSEDCDMGMQIQQAGGKAVLAKGMMVTHKDERNWLHYYKNLFFENKNHVWYEKKWQKYRKTLVSNTQNLRLLLYLWKYVKTTKLRFFKKTILVFHVLFSVLLTKFQKKFFLGKVL
jgi:glycosyltransferase involved in cell wall biosynthesis